MKISEIFENLVKIEPKVVSIETLFNNQERINKTNYKPSYQRNYVWDDEKATYFIESILLGTEIPPLIYFRNGDQVEVIDGRQRYETILRFTKDEFKLKKHGLEKLGNTNISNKFFRNISQDLKNLFWDTKLRIIEFSFHTRQSVVGEMEELVKKEIFKRYNSGITPLKPTEIDRAAYIEDDLNSYFKHKLKADKILFEEVSDLLYFEKSNDEIILKKIRQLLVLHQIPIRYFAVRKDTVIARYFNFLSSNVTEEDIASIFDGFLKKVNILKRLKKIFNTAEIPNNRLMYECVYWALSIVEEEKEGYAKIEDSLLRDLVIYLNEHQEAFRMIRSSFSPEVIKRYQKTAEFFSRQFDIKFDIYLQTTSEFKTQNKRVSSESKDRIGFDELRINKPEPSSIAIVDICRQMSRQRFLIRPPYQRNEVINKNKSSAIIESILLGIKLPPIFVFKRNDEISEVLDGQQRLLSILGYIGEPYLDENNQKRNSNKHEYSLNLKNGILTQLHGKRFDQLSQENKEKIRNFDLWIIEISQKSNQNFESIDLFIRLNSKPYPIKEDTFEMWNSYISRDIIESIKEIHKNNEKWFYFRKNNSRMEDENVYTSLIYLQYSSIQNNNQRSSISKDLDIYKVIDKIVFRVKSKNEITKVLENSDVKESLITACYNFEFLFLKKLKELLSTTAEENPIVISKSLDGLFGRENYKRTQQRFYALWYFLNPISSNVIKAKKKQIYSGLLSLFRLMDGIESKTVFEEKVKDFWNENEDTGSIFDEDVFEAIQKNAPIVLGDICSLITGYNINSLDKYSSQRSKHPFPFLKDISISNFRTTFELGGNVSLDDKDEHVRNLFGSGSKILLKKINRHEGRLQVGILNEPGVPGSENIILFSIRFGFSQKFLLSVLGSRLAAFIIHKNSSSLSGANNLHLSTIKRFPLPIVSSADQVPFERIVDCVRFADNAVAARFFERLLDAMVYEIYFPKQIGDANVNVLQYLRAIDDFSAMGKDAIIQDVSLLYERLSASSHPVSAALLRLLNVKELAEIEPSI